MSEKRMLRVALAGNPNCGKTTIFNALTGANQHVGNYSGVTVEKRDGTFKHDGQEIKVIDLPGTYSLNYHSPEEKVAQEELLSGNIDLLVAIVDSGSLSRSLVFVAQLMQLDLPMVLVLNMWDEAEKAGLQLKIDDMSKLLGMRIVKTVGSRGKGIDELKDAIVRAAGDKAPTDHLRLGDHLANSVKKIKDALPASVENHRDWTATKLLADDPNYIETIGAAEGGAHAVEVAKAERNDVRGDTRLDIKQYLTEQYYGFADGLLKEVTVEKQRENAREMSDKIDKWLAHPVLGLVFFIVIVYALFQITFTLGQYPMDWIEAGFGALSDWLNGLLAENHPGLASLLVDGIIGGVGGVLVFLPNIIILFMGLSFLEDTGYMARTAFLLDKLMHKIGLHGRSFIPLITGFGCSVPGMMATRTIAGEKERLTTMFVIPFMSCGARLPIWLLLVPIFFAEKYQGIAMLGIYLLGVLVAFLVAFCLRKTIFKGDEEPFVMELPPYRMPTGRAILMHMWERAWLYLKKAGTIILALSIVLWWLAAYPKMDGDAVDRLTQEITQTIKTESPELSAAHDAIAAKYGDEIPEQSAFDKKVAEETAKLGDLSEEQLEEKTESIAQNLEKQYPDLFADKQRFDQAQEFQAKVDNFLADKELEQSYMGTVGRFIAPVFKPLGFDWKISTAVVSALAAKEVFVSQMGIVYALGEVDAEDDADEGATTLRDKLRAQYDTATGIALIVFMLLTSPCVASLAVAKREANSWKFALAQFFGMFVIAWVFAAIIRLIGLIF